MLVIVLVILSLICFGLEALSIPRPAVKWWAAGVGFLIAAVYLAPKI